MKQKDFEVVTLAKGYYGYKVTKIKPYIEYGHIIKFYFSKNKLVNHVIEELITGMTE